MKEKFVLTVGFLKLASYYIVLALISILPMLYITDSYFLSAVFIIIQWIIPPASAVFWIWGLVKVIMSDQTIWSIVYYIVFAVVELPFIFVSIKRILSKRYV